MKSTVMILVLAAFWVISIACGGAMIRRFESTPGAAGVAPARWPAASRIHPLPGHSTLVMLVHPQCSCTSASLEELQEIVTRAGGQISAWVLFMKPAGMAEGWERSATWTQAQSIPGATVRADPDAAEASRFGGLTSGYVVVYDPAGRLTFSGGITGARGHVGDNLGRERVLAVLGAAAIPQVSQGHAVYGCPL